MEYHGGGPTKTAEQRYNERFDELQRANVKLDSELKELRQLVESLKVNVNSDAQTKTWYVYAFASNGSDGFEFRDSMDSLLAWVADHSELQAIEKYKDNNMRGAFFHIDLPKNWDFDQIQTRIDDYIECELRF